MRRGPEGIEDSLRKSGAVGLEFQASLMYTGFTRGSLQQLRLSDPLPNETIARKLRGR